MSGVAMVGGQILGMMNDQMTNQNNMQNSESFDILTRQRQEASQVRMLHNQYVEHNKMKSANLKADIEAYKKNGMNVGLIYGGSGAGGTTTTSSGTNGGSAPTSNGMGIIQGGQMGMQMAQLQADLNLKDAQADNLRADAENKRGVDREEAESRIKLNTQGVANGKAKEALDRINTEIQNLEERKLSGTINEQMNEIAWKAEKMMHDAKIAGSEDYVAYKSRDNNVKIIQETAVGKVLENALTAQSTEESKARVKKMAEDIVVNYMNAYTNKRNASTQELQQI